MRIIVKKIDLKSLFTDESENFLTPMEPLKGGKVNIRFRTARDNVEQVLIYGNHGVTRLEKTYSDQMFDYYSEDILLEDTEYNYYFEIINDDDSVFYDKMGPTLNPEKQHRFKIIPGFKTPEWTKGAVMYQIYTDRFCNGDSNNNVETGEYSYIGEHVIRNQDWYKYPDPLDVRTFYGGDIKGAMSKLEYLQKLGIQAVYFNPLFVSPSNHKYDTEDYDNIDPHLGVIINDGGELLQDGDNDNEHATKYIKRVTDKENLEASNALFAEFVKEAHERGIKVIIDGVFNHCGSFNKWMDREKIYKNSSEYEDGAYISENSKYKNYFTFYDDNWPDNKSYDGWWEHDTLPKLNYEGSKELEEYILYIGRKWVSPPYNADGWRLDVAADLGHSEEYNHNFWKKFRNEVKEANPEAIILAEHYGDPGMWLDGSQWDTVMNYDAFMEPITWFLTGMEKHSDKRIEELKGDADTFVNTMYHFMSRFSWPSLITAMNQLSNHDHSRFMTRTNEKVGRTSTLGAESADEGIRKSVMKEAVVIQMTWPGAPTLYYGDEAGLCGWTDPDNRRGYPWGKEDLELLEFHRDAIRIHRENPALWRGSLKILAKDYNVISYGRFIGDNKVITIINNNEYPKDVTVNAWEIGISKNADMDRILITYENCYNAGKLRINLEKGVLKVNMPPKSAAIYKDVI